MIWRPTAVPDPTTPNVIPPGDPIPYWRIVVQKVDRTSNFIRERRRDSFVSVDEKHPLRSKVIACYPEGAISLDGKRFKFVDEGGCAAVTGDTRRCVLGSRVDKDQPGVGPFERSKTVGQVRTLIARNNRGANSSR